MLPHNKSFIFAREFCISCPALSCQETTLASSLQIKALEATAARLLCDAASRQEAADNATHVAQKQVAGGTEALRMEMAAHNQAFTQQVGS